MALFRIVVVCWGNSAGDLQWQTDRTTAVARVNEVEQHWALAMLVAWTENEEEPGLLEVEQQPVVVVD